jgi:hypothetical protein
MHAPSSIRQERRPAPSSHQPSPQHALTCADASDLTVSPAILRVLAVAVILRPASMALFAPTWLTCGY